MGPFAYATSNNSNLITPLFLLLHANFLSIHETSGHVMHEDIHHGLFIQATPEYNIMESRSRNVGYLAIVECTDKLCASMSLDPLTLSEMLLAKGLVSDAQVRNSQSQLLDDKVKASMLLEVITRQIQAFPEKFETLLGTLEQIPCHRDVVKLLREKGLAQASVLDHHFSQGSYLHWYSQ